MIPIRTVLCPVDFSERTGPQTDLAADLARAFDARLILHHNVVDVAIGSGVKWMWDARTPSAASADDELRKLLARVSGLTAAEARITQGPAADAIVGFATDIGADLVVLSTRGGPADAEDAVTARVLERTSVPVLAMRPATDERRIPTFTAAGGGRQALLAATDLAPGASAAIEVALDLARRFAFDLHLLCVLAGRGVETAAIDEARRRLLSMVPADQPAAPVPHVEAGDPPAVIARIAGELSAACIVMSEVSADARRHWPRTRPDVPHAVLQHAACPVWYVPAAHDVLPSRPLVDERRDSAFHYWPSSYLYAVVDSREKAESALQRLVQTGAPRESLRTWHGDGADETIDPSGSRHGRGARLWRSLEKLTGEHDLFQDYAAEVRGGHVVIGVRCGSEGKAIAADILRAHGAHRMAYLSVGSVERLGA